MSKKGELRYIIDSFTDYERDYIMTQKQLKKKVLKKEKKIKLIEIVKNMLNKGLDLNLIFELSGLSIEEINKLKN